MSNIDEKAKNNFTIEMRIFENYEIIKAIDFLGNALGCGTKFVVCVQGTP